MAYVTGHWPDENGAMRYEVGECWGTKEREECNCDGDTTRCTFYPERRMDNNTYQNGGFISKETLNKLRTQDKIDTRYILSNEEQNTLKEAIKILEKIGLDNIV